jgi:YfiH family protein
MKVYKSKILKSNHCFTTKNGGVSKGYYSTLNLAYHVGDLRDDVEENHKILSDYLGYDYKKVVYMNQIHSDIVYKIDQTNKDRVLKCDALITNEKNIPIMAMGADCSCVIFEDIKKGVIAVAHIGRAGAYKNLVSKVIKKMKTYFFSNIKDIKVVIGPNIKSCCYEVSVKEIDEAKKLGYGFACIGRNLDIDKIIKFQLNFNGINDKNIDFIKKCTKCNSGEFFSYRSSKITGRNCGVVFLS